MPDPQVISLASGKHLIGSPANLIPTRLAVGSFSSSNACPTEDGNESRFWRGGMQRKQIGRSGLWVSELCIGCMTFGEPARGGIHGHCPRNSRGPLIEQAVAEGVDFFDTANVYSDGSSEEILGRCFGNCTRDRIVLATKSSAMPIPITWDCHEGRFCVKSICH